MQSPGAKLRELRLKKGASLEEVHKKTKIHTDILKAMEEDNLAHLNPVYIRGFLKIYCQFLGVDSREYISDYKDRQIPINIKGPQDDISGNAAIHPEEKTHSTARINLAPWVKQVAIYLVIVVFVCAVLFMAISGIKKILASRPKPVLKKTKAVAVAAPKRLSVNKTPVKQAVKPVKKPVTEKVSLPVKPQPVTKLEKKEVSSPSGAVIRLGVRAKEDCWIQMKVDGKTVFQNKLKEGRFEFWEAKDKIELSLGNAGNVDLELNGKLLMALGRKGQSLRDIVITRDGLKVGK